MNRITIIYVHLQRNHFILHLKIADSLSCCFLQYMLLLPNRPTLNSQHTFIMFGTQPILYKLLACMYLYIFIQTFLLCTSNCIKLSHLVYIIVLRVYIRRSTTASIMMIRLYIIFINNVVSSLQKQLCFVENHIYTHTYMGKFVGTKE